MYQTICMSILVVSQLAVIASAQTDLNIDVTIRGTLVRSPGAYSEKNPHINIKQQDTEFLFALAMPGGDSVRDAVAEFMDREVVVSGKMKIDTDAEHKDGTRRTEYNIIVDGLKITKSRQTILECNAPHDRWIVFTHNNGLSIIDKTTNQTHEIYPPIDSPEESAIDWSASATFSPDGKTLYTRQGLSDHLWRFPEFKAVGFGTNSEKKELFTLSFAGFSNDGKYLVMHGYSRAKIPDTLLVYQCETGKELARTEFEEPTFNCRFIFVNSARNAMQKLIVAADQSVFQLDLENGKSTELNQMK